MRQEGLQSSPRADGHASAQCPFRKDGRPWRKPFGGWRKLLELSGTPGESLWRREETFCCPPPLKRWVARRVPSPEFRVPSSEFRVLLPIAYCLLPLAFFGHSLTVAARKIPRKKSYEGYRSCNLRA